MRKVYTIILYLFITVSLTAQQAPFTFIHVSDIHVSTEASFVNVCDLNGVMAKCYLHTFATMAPKPAFILATGDISNIGNSSSVSGGMYSALTQYLFPHGLTYPAPGALYIDSAQTIPMYFSPGNHDYYTTLLPPGTLTQLNTLGNYAQQIAPDTDYAVTTDVSVILFMRSGWDISYLISTDPKGSGLTDAQINWIRSQLSANSTKRKMMVMHHPASNYQGLSCNSTSGTISNDSSATFYVNREEFLNICDSFHVDVILAGHSHQNVITDRSGNVVSENCTTCGTRFVQTGPAFTGCYRTITVDSSFVTVSTPQVSCSSTTSLKDLEKELELSIYPDPSNGVFNLNIGQVLPVTVKVFNIYGQCVYQQSSTFSSLQMDLHSQPNGLYFLQLVVAQESATETINFKYPMVIAR